MRQTKEYIWKCKGGILKLAEHEIWYIHTEQKKTYIHTRNRVYQIFTSLKKEEEFLHEIPVIRVHQGYLTHMAKVESLVGNAIILKNGEQIPVSSQRRKTALERLQKFANEK